MDINELTARIRSAGYVLNLMEETGASNEALIQQVEYLRGLRAELNAECPASSLAAGEYNITETV